MPDGREKIKQVEGLIEHGLSVSAAVSQALGVSISEFARSRGFRHSEVSMCLNGYPQRVYPEIRDAICAAFGAEREWLDGLIDPRRSTDGAPHRVRESA